MSGSGAKVAFVILLFLVGLITAFDAWAITGLVIVAAGLASIVIFWRLGA